MMVIFVSQCEKNALKKTRRVLDAFADRVGDSTWKTVITEEGLATVQKMLKQTASKSTSVSCHWIRSRSRADLLWVVGNKSKFNEQGIVPVNSTSKDLKIDEYKTISNNYLANTKGQSLDKHLFAVGYVSYCLVKKFIKNNERFALAVFVAGCLHDIGKLDPEFQKWILSAIKKKFLLDELPEDGYHIDKGKFTFEKHARHNEVSLLLYQFFDDEHHLGNKKLREYVEHVLYWHHAKPLRKEEYKTIKDIYRSLENSLGDLRIIDILRSVDLVVKSINQLIATYDLDSSFIIKGFKMDSIDSIVDSFKKIYLPFYKEYDSEEVISKYCESIKYNAHKNIARSCVITADRLVSTLSPKELDELIENNTLHTLLDAKIQKDNNLCIKIRDCLDSFERKFPNSEQNKLQHKAALDLGAVEEIAVLQGPAGCGKTKISLEWALLTNAKKIIWICPRVQICEGLFIELTSQEYLSSAKIEICTGEIKFIQENSHKIETIAGEEFSGDIVLTTIDQIVNTIITHSNVTSLIEFMNVHVVFDEFHEYIHMPAFNLLFSELIECKKLQESEVNTILVSATPNYFFINEVLRIDQEDVISIKSFNEKPYQIQFVNYDETEENELNPLFQAQPQNTIVISNTAITAQRSFILNQSRENAILFHSRFTKEDKLNIFEKMFNCFKKDGSKEYDLLRSGPIVQASLNITCERMVTEFSLAENILQRLGRLDRFGKNKEINKCVIAIPRTLSEGKRSGNCARFLSKLNMLQSALAWYECLKEKTADQSLTINDIYKIYLDFYSAELYKKYIEQDIISALKISVQRMMEKIQDPICRPQKNHVKKRYRLKKKSLRDDSRYVQMAICKINNDCSVEYLNSYACDDDGENTFTLSISEIYGYDVGGEKDLLSYMHQKHHKIFTIKSGEKIKKEHKVFLLRDKAVDSKDPIYLSYTDEDLALTNDKPHSHSIYYAIGENEKIVGAISINKLNSTFNNEE